MKPCPRRSGQPCAPLNHETRTRDGEVVVDRWFCSCGRIMAPPEDEKP